MAYMRADRVEPDGLAERGRGRRSRALEERAGKRLGDAGGPAARLRALGRARVDAGDDGHGPQPRAQRTRRSRAWRRGRGNPRFAWDAYRRFVQMYGNVCRGIPGERFEEAIAARKREAGVELDVELGEADLRALVGAFKAIYADATGEDVPAGPGRAAARGDPRRVRLVAGQARGDLPADQPHPRRLGHGLQRAADGVRQQGPRRRARAWRSRATRSRARRSRRATSSSTRRARTWSRACARRRTSPRWRR